MTSPTASSPPRASRRTGNAPRSRSASAELARRAALRRRAAVARRRRRGALFAAVITVGALLLLVAPSFRQAVNSLTTLPLRDASIIRRQAKAKHLDPALIAAVIYAETKFEPRTSSAGAEGLMQILPQTAQDLARRSGARTFTTADLATPEVNIAYGSYYLRYLLSHYGGDELLAVAAYNGGVANVDRWARASQADGHRLTVSEIPFPETRAYAQKVLQAQREYRRTYASELGLT